MKITPWFKVASIVFFLSLSVDALATFSFLNLKNPQCRAQCDMNFGSCSSVCVNSYENCKIKGKRTAAMSFVNYVRQQRIAGKPINRDLNSFYDPLQCTKTTCDCEADHRACIRVCNHSMDEKS